MKEWFEKYPRPVIIGSYAAFVAALTLGAPALDKMVNPELVAAAQTFDLEWWQRLMASDHAFSALVLANPTASAFIAALFGAGLGALATSKFVHSKLDIR